jgi:hypothetical protein
MKRNEGAMKRRKKENEDSHSRSGGMNAAKQGATGDNWG